MYFNIKIMFYFVAGTQVVLLEDLQGLLKLFSLQPLPEKNHSITYVEVSASARYVPAPYPVP